MSDLIVIGYENPQTARQAYEQVQRLQQDFVVELRGLAIVDVDADGKTHVDTPQRISGSSVRPQLTVPSLASCSACCSSSRAWSCLAAQSAR